MNRLERILVILVGSLAATLGFAMPPQSVFAAGVLPRETGSVRIPMGGQFAWSATWVRRSTSCGAHRDAARARPGRGEGLAENSLSCTVFFVTSNGSESLRRGACRKTHFVPRRPLRPVSSEDSRSRCRSNTIDLSLERHRTKCLDEGSKEPSERLLAVR